MKKIISMLLALVMTLSLSCVSYAKPGDIVGYACHTDIIAEINGAQIPSYNVNGYTYIVAEDLVNYGFNANWYPEERVIEVTRNYGVRNITANYQKPYVSKSQIGKKAYNILDTNINASLSGYHLYSFVEGEFVQSYNINGRTIIPFDMMDIFGTVEWHPYARKITLTIPGVNFKGQGNKTAQTVKNEFYQRAQIIEADATRRADKAFSQQDMNGDSWLTYRTWDVLLNEVYQYLKINLSSSEFSRLKQNQINWVNQKEAAVRQAEEDYYGGSIAPLMANIEGIEFTSERCYTLISMIK